MIGSVGKWIVIFLRILYSILAETQGLLSGISMYLYCLWPCVACVLSTPATILSCKSCAKRNDGHILHIPNKFAKVTFDSIRPLIIPPPDSPGPPGSSAALEPLPLPTYCSKRCLEQMPLGSRDMTYENLSKSNGFFVERLNFLTNLRWSLFILLLFHFIFVHVFCFWQLLDTPGNPSFR